MADLCHLVARHCSLHSRRITHQERCHLLTMLASGALWWQIWVPPSGKTLLASLAQNLIPRKASSAHRSRCLLVAPPGSRSAPPNGTTLLASLTQNHIPRQASSAHRSRCSQVAPPSGKTLLASLAQNHIPRQASSTHRSRCSLVAPPGGRSGCHQVAIHCSLRSRRITYQDRRHLPIARVAR